MKMFDIYYMTSVSVVQSRGWKLMEPLEMRMCNLSQKCMLAMHHLMLIVFN